MWTNLYLKTTIITRALLISVIGFYVSLFLLEEWLGSGVWLVAVFCILPYAIIYFHREWKYGIWLLALASIWLWFYLGWSLYLALWFIAALIGFYQTAEAIHEDVHNKVKVSDFGVFTGESVEKFVTYMTLTYVFSFISLNSTFNLSCAELYHYSDKALDIALLRDSNIKKYVEWFFVTSIKPIIETPSIGAKTIITDGNTTNKPIPKPVSKTTTSDPGAKYRVPSTDTTSSDQWWSIIDAIQVHQAAEALSGNEAVLTSIKKLNDIRQTILNQTIDQGNNIEEWVCSVVFKEIKTKYNNPNFKISVIFMMYLVMRPAMEMVLHLISYVNWAIFRVMFKMGWFKKYEDWEVSENLE